MVEFEADDALAAGAHFAAQDERVEKVCIWTPDKDLAQCVVGQRVVQIDRRAKLIRDEQGVRTKFGVAPEFIPDYLALVGDSADGYPGIAGLGPRTAATLINRHGPIEKFPSNVLGGANLEHALLFKHLATLRIDAPLFEHSLEPLAPDAEVIYDVEQLHWNGPTKSFAAMAEKMGDPTLAKRVASLANSIR
jgi:5'-3' exonuclease